MKSKLILGLLSLFMVFLNDIMYGELDGKLPVYGQVPTIFKDISK